MKSYFEKLQDPRWQKRRLEIMQRDEFTCQECKRKDATLTVHHRWYEKGKDPWDYKDHVLVTLCEPCHCSIEERLQLIRQTSGALNVADLDMVLGFCLAANIWARQRGKVDMSGFEYDPTFCGVAKFVGLTVQDTLNELAQNGMELNVGVIGDMIRLANDASVNWSRN